MMPSPPSFRIYLLGQPRLVFEGEPYKVPSRPKALALLAYLLLHRSCALAREKLAFTLWEDDPEEDARANLRRHLHLLSQALPPAPSQVAWILADTDTVQWNPQANAWVDVDEFKRLAEIGADRAKAVDLYSGDLLEASYDEWVFAERDRLRNTYLLLLADLVIECRGRRDFAHAADYAQRILTNDPWREDTLRQLMSVRYESGDRAGALAAFQQFERRLRDEMGVDTMAETSALRDIILRNEPLPAVAPTSSLSAVSAFGTRLLPFVGREAEMDQLRAAWSRAARGHGNVVLVSGEAGIGKSRLVSEFALMAEAQGARVMTGATAYPESRPYQAIAEAFRGVSPLLASLRVQRVWLSALAQAVPELRARISDLPEPPKVEPSRERGRLFEAFSTCLAALSHPRPLVLILEDMHWAGETSVAALQFMCRMLSTVPVLVIATYRDEEAPRTHPLRSLRRQLQEEHVLTAIAPRSLRREAVAELVDKMSASVHNTPGLVDELVRRSAGNPLFLGEFIHGLRDGEDARTSPPPASLKLAIAMRVEKLPEATRALAEVAAVIGQGFNVELARDVAGWSENEVLDALNVLIDRNFVKETGGRSGYDYAFSHHLFQSTIYAGVPADVRVRRHRRTARVLQETHQERHGEFAADIARHYDLGNEPQPAAAGYLTAARRAQDVYAYEEALHDLGRCLELTQDDQTRREALGCRESIHATQGDREAQAEDLKELERSARETADPASICDVLRRRVAFARAVGERDQERVLIDELDEEAARSGDARLRAEALVARAAYATLTGGHAEGRKAAEAALAIYQGLGDAAGQIEARCRLVEIASEGGAFDLASKMLAEVRAAPEAAANQRLVARAITSATFAAITERKYGQCRELALEARAVYRTIGDREGEADMISRQASAAARLSLLEEARQCYEEAGAMYRAIGKRLGLAAVLANGGIHSVRLGLVYEAEKSLTEAAEQFKSLKDVRGETACAVNLSYIHLLRGAPAEAKRYALAALDLARAMPHAGYEAAALGNLGLAERDLGELDAAAGHMEEGIAVRRRLSERTEYADDIAQLAHVYVLAGNLDAARALSSELVESLRAASPAVFMPQSAFLAAALVFQALRERGRAREMLKRAQESVEEQAAAIAGPVERAAFLSMNVNRHVETAVRANGKRSGASRLQKSSL